MGGKSITWLKLIPTQTKFAQKIHNAIVWTWNIEYMFYISWLRNGIFTSMNHKWKYEKNHVSLCEINNKTFSILIVTFHFLWFSNMFTGISNIWFTTWHQNWLIFRTNDRFPLPYYHIWYIYINTIIATIITYWNCILKYNKYHYSYGLFRKVAIYKCTCVCKCLGLSIHSIIQLFSSCVYLPLIGK